MTLLKNDRSRPEKSHKVEVSNIGLNIRDGWQFGIGFGLAMTIAIPVILLLLSCIIGIGVTILGSSLGALLGG